jgi:amidohydrolase
LEIPLTGTLTPGSVSLVEIRRQLHRHPELRFEEHETAALIARRLEAAGLDVRTGVAGTGVVATLVGAANGPHVIVRADMDAVPTPDLKMVPYASEVAGIAHACGHDVHTTVVLGAGEQLAREGVVRGRVTLVFQPAEEIPFGERSGGRAIVASGVLDKPPADAVLGLHCWPGLPTGVVGLDRDVAMAAKDAFRIHINGSGAHAATPSRGRDAVLAASQIVVGLHLLLGREIDPGERAALNVGTIHGGTSQSIVPALAEITGTIRSVDTAVRLRLKGAVERVAGATAQAAGLEHVIEWANEMPAVRNAPQLVDRAQAVLAGCPEVAEVRLLDAPPMTTDDFALYAERVPGLYLKLGVCGSRDGTACPSLHDGRFDVDERAIDVGVGALVSLARSLLERRPEDGR